VSVSCVSAHHRADRRSQPAAYPKGAGIYRIVRRGRDPTTVATCQCVVRWAAARDTARHGGNASGHAGGNVGHGVILPQPGFDDLVVDGDRAPSGGAAVMGRCPRRHTASACGCRGSSSGAFATSGMSPPTPRAAARSVRSVGLVEAVEIWGYGEARIVAAAGGGPWHPTPDTRNLVQERFSQTRKTRTLRPRCVSRNRGDDWTC